MPDREQLQSLLGRVEKATGPDRELDATLDYFFEFQWEGREFDNLGGFWREHRATKRRERFNSSPAATFTASIDSALALVERVLPGHAISVGTYQQGPWGPSPWARLFREGHWTTPGGGHWTAHGASIPLAILTALLSALISESKPKQETQSIPASPATVKERT